MWGNCIASVVIEYLSGDDLSEGKRENINERVDEKVEGEDNLGMEMSDTLGTTHIADGIV